MSSEALIDHSSERIGQAIVKVVGIGGGGCNAVTRMYHERILGVEYMAVNTDAQHLMQLDVPTKIRVGDKLTRGLGVCLLYTSPSPRDRTRYRMPSSA